MTSLGGQPDLLIDAPAGPTFDFLAPDAPPDVLVLPQTGPEGPPGVVSGQPRFVGDGPPPQVIFGANPGDRYLDEQSGEIWTLQ